MTRTGRLAGNEKAGDPRRDRRDKQDGGRQLLEGAAI